MTTIMFTRLVQADIFAKTSSLNDVTKGSICNSVGNEFTGGTASHGTSNGISNGSKVENVSNGTYFIHSKAKVKSS